MSDQVWITDRRYQILGTTLRVVTQDQSLADRIDSLLAEFETSTRPARLVNTIQITGQDGEPRTIHKGCYRQDSGDFQGIIPAVIGLINQQAIANLRFFATHSAVIAHNDRIVALPADSGGGKSTIAAAAIMGGFSYLSDEALIINDDGLVVPYPKPLALSPWSCERLGLGVENGEKLVQPADLGGTTHHELGKLTDVVIARYDQEKTSFRPTVPSTAVIELLSKSFNHYKDPERAFRLVTESARNVNVWQLDYAHPKDAALLLVENLSWSG